MQTYSETTKANVVRRMMGPQGQSATGGGGTSTTEGACGPSTGNSKYCVCASFQAGTKKTCSGEDFPNGKTLCLKSRYARNGCECRPFVCAKAGDYCQCGVNYAGYDKAMLASQGFSVVDSCTATKCATSTDGSRCECGKDPSGDIEVPSCSLEAVIEAVETDKAGLSRAGTKCSADETLE